MNHRERVRMALEHKKTDRVPIDFGSTANTGITIKAYESLKRYLGIKKPTLELDKVMQVAKVDEEVLELFDVDTRGVHPKPSGNKFLKNDSYEDMWGILRTRPKSSLYYDVIRGPFQYDFSISDLDKFNWPDGKEKSRIKGVREEIRSYYDKGYAVVVNMRVAFVEFSQLMMGMENWCIDILTNPSRVCELMDRILNFHLDLTSLMLNGVGEKVDIVTYGDDLGTQKGPLVSPELYRKHIKPRQSRLIKLIKEKTSAKIFYHSCGDIYSLIPDFIEIGIDILNPIQPVSKNMDLNKLKQEFGNKLTLSGGIDTQRLLPYGSPEDVRVEVKKRIKQMEGGGYILNSVHNIQSDVPPENIIAMFEAALSFS